MMTSCKDCVFAKYRDNTQYGCEFARLERFQINGGIHLTESKYVTGKDARERGWPDAETIAVWDIAEYAIQNGEAIALVRNKVQPAEVDKVRKQYYIINRFCTRCRDKNWAKDTPETELKAKAVEESKLRLSVVGVVDQFRLEWLDDFIESISKQKLPVGEVIILNCLGVNRAGSISAKMEELSVKFNIQDYKIVSVITTQPQRVAINELLGENKIKNIYCSFFRLPYTMPENFSSQIDIALNERLEQFVYLEADQGETVSTNLFNMLSGYKEIDLYERKMSNLADKVKAVAEEHNQHYLIRPLSEIVS